MILGLLMSEDVIICDAAPIIFLGKIDKLWLLSELYNKRVEVLRIISDEVMRKPFNPLEEIIFNNFFNTTFTIDYRKSLLASSALSEADKILLGYAAERRSILLTDDNLLRKVAVYEKIKVIGTLGILLLGYRKFLLNFSEAKDSVHELIQEHNFRISIEVYEKFLEILNQKI